ncbi:oligosaccharide flippase family protein [Accumulibacter sp.]|uniref:oligosaccharide flippase family protein n=1 Tax=Accumulibacter sp. TaxID=2053492 RepID=UPI0026072D3D|nr:oligosaccharide flippase family protein [Accumulibacter sp.]HRD89030.1 oligosaccharide flippase family protein [Accumulibacter sp.]
MPGKFIQHPVTRNAGALLFIQSLVYLAPLLSVPHLTRSLGLAAYGALALSLSLIPVAVLMLDYGMTLAATPRISEQRLAPERVGELLGAILVIKTAIFLVLTAILGLLLHYALPDTAQQTIAWLTLLSSAAIALQPVWLLQGIERAGPLAWAALAAQLGYLSLVLLWVRTPGDVVWALVAQSLAQALAAGIGWRAVLRAGFAPRRPPPASVRDLLHSSSPFFASRLAVASYTMTGTAAVGLTTSTKLAAGYFLAEQIFKALQALVYPLTQALYAHLAASRDLRLLWTVGATVSIVFWCGGIVVVVAAPWIISVVAGDEFLGSVTTLRIFMLALAFSVPSLFLGYPLFSAVGQPAGANRAVIIASGIHVTVLATLVATQTVTATAIAAATALTEGCVLALRMRDAAMLLRYHRPRVQGQ